jgi:AcrR family transcriptional regulator
MTPHPAVKPPRERILDAAFEVMRSLGLAKTTTKQIALQAGYSEAMLYKHFADKQELFLAVLQERVPPAGVDATKAGSGDLIDNLTGLVDGLMAFFTATFPIAASVFSSPELLRQHRDGVMARDHGPNGPVRAVEAYLRAEQSIGRIAARADCAATAQILVGTAFHQGFLAAFAGQDVVTDSHGVARAIALTVSRSLA